MSWTTKPLGELCNLTMGRTPSRSNPKFWDRSRGTRNVWISIADMTRCATREIFDSKEYLTDAGSKQFSKVKKGTILLSFKLTIGRVAIAGVDLQTNEAIAAMNDLNEMEILRDYLYYYLLAFNWDELIKGRFKVKGNTLNKRILLQLPVRYPSSLSLQKETVERLDREMGYLSKRVEIDASRQTLISDLRRRLCREAIEELHPKKYFSLRELSTVITKGTTPTSVGYAFTNSGVNFLKVETIASDGSIVFPKMAWISTECHSALGRSQLMEGDLLISIAGALGRAALVPREICPANINQALAVVRIRPEVGVSAEFILSLFHAGYYDDVVESLAAGAAQQNLSLAQIGDLRVPYLEEGKDLVFQTTIRKLDALVVEAEKRIARGKLLVSDLQAAILVNELSLGVA